jgi:CBS domain-containing protein
LGYQAKILRHVEDLIISDVITVKRDCIVKHAESLMKYFKIDCLIVLENKEPVGIITLKDINKQVNNSNLDPNILLVEEIMSEPIFWVTPSTPEEEAIQILKEKKINQLPVIGNISSGPILLGILKIGAYEVKQYSLF